jgi:hypothetical protein
MCATPPAPTPAVSANPRCLPPIQFLGKFNAIFFGHFPQKKQRLDFWFSPPTKSALFSQKQIRRCGQRRIPFFGRKRSAARLYKRHPASPASGSRKIALFPQNQIPRCSGFFFEEKARVFGVVLKLSVVNCFRAIGHLECRAKLPWQASTPAAPRQPRAPHAAQAVEAR